MVVEAWQGVQRPQQHWSVAGDGWVLALRRGHVRGTAGPRLGGCQQPRVSAWVVYETMFLDLSNARVFTLDLGDARRSRMAHNKPPNSSLKLYSTYPTVQLGVRRSLTD